jgi:eukaryotic-like serine/threonine-protein kinase
MATITDSIGRVLAGRYRIESALGSGASAHVFGAWDVTLRRRVAIKVLHPALVGDTAFLRRFRAEAQAAASLAHPHVLAVHDWGEDERGPFLVLELCAGGSLRDILDDDRRLTVAQTLMVGAEAADGLAFAHARGFVHRDIKPANLLFGEDGRLRVADFGLARALAETAWTEPVGTTLGTARYAAPEQAQGRPVDGRGDVYSLALVLYEAVTGMVPFTADTTIATLMARVGAQLPGHDSLGVLSGVLQAAAAPDREQRIDASSLAARLRALSAEMPPAEPLPLVGPGGQGFSSPSDLRAAGRWTDDVTELGALPQGPDAAEPSGAGDAAAGWNPRQRPERDRRRGRRLGAPVRVVRRFPKAAAAVLVTLMVLGGAAYGIDASQILVASHRLPSLTDDTRAVAAGALSRDHLVLRITGHEWSITVPAGHVTRQVPAAGTSVKEGSRVGVVPSSGPPPVAVPSLTSVTGGCPQATAVLTAAKLRAQCADQSSTTFPSGKVMSWIPQGHAPEGSSVRVTVSSGPPIETIPSLTGSTCQGATTALDAVGLVAKCQPVYSASVPNGQVVVWSPTGQALEGATVTVQVSEGPPPVPVPDIVGMRLGPALAALQNEGLTVGSISGPGSGLVVSASPSVGSSVPPGTTVDITMAS